MSAPMTPPSATELDAYWSPSFAKDLERGLPHIKTLHLRFKEILPDPEIDNMQTLERQLEKGLPNLNNLYIINEIDRNTKYIPEIALSLPMPKHPFNTRDWHSLKVQHLPWQFTHGMRSIPTCLDMELEELVIDVKDYVIGPLAWRKWEMVNLMKDIWEMHSYISKCKKIFWKGWALSEEVEQKWKEGKMTEEYHKEVVQELILQNNERQYGITMARIFNDMTTHEVDFRVYFQNGYELTGRVAQFVGSFIFGGFPGKEVEIGRRGYVFGQKEWDYPGLDWMDFRSPRGTHPPPGRR